MIEGYEYLDYIIDYMVKEIDSKDFKELLVRMAEDVQKELGKRYDVVGHLTGNYHYTGLCDESVRMIDYIISNVSVRKFKNIGTIYYHGEQRHCPVIESRNWIYEHTWCAVVYNGEKWYMDVTCKQFDRLYDDIPEYYISKDPPKWYYSDKENPIFKKGLLRKINENFRLHLKLCYDTKIEIGIIEAIQFGIWGKISDHIRRKRITGG